MQTTTRRDITIVAHELRGRADAAHQAGDTATRDALLRQAAAHYRAAELHGMALWCERFIGK